MSGLIDSHAHLDHEDLVGDRQGILERASAAGVVQLITVASDLASTRRSIELAEAYPQVFATAGIHPHEAAKAQPGDLAAVEELAHHQRVVAIGESGLDYYYDFSPRSQQQELLAQNIDLARRLAKPLIVHVRDAHQDALAALGPASAAGLKGVIHCFTGALAEARRYVELGFYLSFSGIITFPKAEEIRQVAAWAPAERILVETDSPYLAPVPRRGKRNEPAYVLHTAELLGQLRGLSREEIITLTAANTRALFRLPPPMI